MSNIVDNVLGVIKQVTPLIGSLTGSPLLGLALKIGQDALQLGRDVKANHQVTDQAELDARLAELEATISANVDETAASLRGG